MKDKLDNQPASSLGTPGLFPIEKRGGGGLGQPGEKGQSDRRQEPIKWAPILSQVRMGRVRFISLKKIIPGLREQKKKEYIVHLFTWRFIIIINHFFYFSILKSGATDQQVLLEYPSPPSCHVTSKF